VFVVTQNVANNWRNMDILIMHYCLTCAPPNNPIILNLVTIYFVFSLSHCGKCLKTVTRRPLVVIFTVADPSFPVVLLSGVVTREY